MTVIWRWAMAYVHWLVIDTVTQPDVTALCCVTLGALPYRSGLYLLLQQQCFNGAYLFYSESLHRIGEDHRSGVMNHLLA